MIQAVSTDDRFLVQVLRSCRAPRLRSMAEFAEAEIVLPDGPHVGLKFRLDRQPYSRLLLSALEGSGRPWRRRVITGPTQSGKTLSAFVIPTMWHLFERGEDVICGVPNLDMAGEKWEDDFKPAIEASRYRDLLPTRGSGSRGGTPSAVRFANGASLKFMCGGGGPKQRAGKTTRVLVITETDGMDEPGSSASREGDKISQLEGRVRAHGLSGLVYMECTVTTTEGRTWREYQASTASRIICPCPHCGRWVSPEREDLIGWQAAETKLAAGRLARFACPSCTQPIDEPQRRAMNRACRLLHSGQEVTDDGTITGQPVETDTFGFRWSAFHNLFSPLELLGQEEWSAAQDENRDNAETIRKQQAWALPVEPDKAEAVDLSKAIIRGSDSRYGGRCNGLERRVVPDDCQAVTLHVDPGWSTYRRTFWWALVAHCGASPRRMHVADYDTFDPRTADTRDEAFVLRCLDAVRNTLLDQPPKDRHGNAVPIRVATVDCGAMTDPICGWVMRYAHEGWRAAKGLSSSPDESRDRKQYMHPTKSTADVRVAPSMDRWYLSRQRVGGGTIWVHNLDVDYWKLRVHGSFALPPGDSSEPVPGSVTLWGTDPQAHHILAEHVMAERYQVAFKQGKGADKRWVKHEKENHLLDCLAGACAGENAANMMTGTVAPRVVISAGESRPDGRHW